MVMLIVCECESTNIADVILSKVLSNIFCLLCSLVDEIIVADLENYLFTCVQNKVHVQNMVNPRYVAWWMEFL